MSVLFLTCFSCTEQEIVNAQPPIKTEVEPLISKPDSVITPPKQDSVFHFINNEFQIDLLASNERTPLIEFVNGSNVPDEYLLRATIDIHILGGKQRLDIVLFNGVDLVKRDSIIINEQKGYIYSGSHAKRVEAPAFDKAYLRLINLGDSTSNGVVIRRVSFLPY